MPEPLAACTATGHRANGTKLPGGWRVMPEFATATGAPSTAGPPPSIAGRPTAHLAIERLPLDSARGDGREHAPHADLPKGRESARMRTGLNRQIVENPVSQEPHADLVDYAHWPEIPRSSGVPGRRLSSNAAQMPATIIGVARNTFTKISAVGDPPMLSGFSDM